MTASTTSRGPVNRIDSSCIGPTTQSLTGGVGEDQPIVTGRGCQKTALARLPCEGSGPAVILLPMLHSLSVRDFAVIAAASFELDPGLTVLTGETGAGKSILVGALQLLLGERASAELVRAGSERAWVQGRFLLPADHPVRPRLAE